jgi:ACT domain-containing protein
VFLPGRKRDQHRGDRRFHDTAKLYVKNLNKTVKLLQKLNYIIDLRDVLLIDIENRPGALADLTTKLGDEGINIDYLYGTVSHKPNMNTVILDVNKIDEAMRILEA